MDNQTQSQPAGEGKTFQEKYEDMLIAIKRGDTGGVRSPLAAAFLEDEAVRLAAERNAKSYLVKKDENEGGMPFWMWALLYFILGILADITIIGAGDTMWRYLNTGGF